MNKNQNTLWINQGKMSKSNDAHKELSAISVVTQCEGGGPWIHGKVISHYDPSYNISYSDNNISIQCTTHPKLVIL